MIVFDFLNKFSVFSSVLSFTGLDRCSQFPIHIDHSGHYHVQKSHLNTVGEIQGSSNNANLNSLFLHIVLFTISFKVQNILLFLKGRLYLLRKNWTLKFFSVIFQILQLLLALRSLLKELL